MNKKIIPATLLLMNFLAFTSCQSDDESIREEVIKIIDNKNIMVDVTQGHVTLSGYVFDEKDTADFDKKIKSIQGVTEVENNISYFDENAVED